MATTSTNTLPPQYIQDLLTQEGTGLFPQLSSALDAEYQRYRGPRVAGFTPDQQRAFQLARESVGATQPQEQAAQQLLEQSLNELMSGTGAAQDYVTQSVTAGNDWLTQALNQAQGLSQQGNPLFGDAQSLIQQSTVGPTSAGLQPFMDPYQQSVIDATMQELDRQDSIAKQSRDANMVAQGAFGGSRQAVIDAEAGRNLSDVKARTLAQLNSQNYGQALNAFQNQQGRLGQAGGQLGSLGQSQLAGQMQGINQMLAGGANLSDILMGAAGTQAGIAGQRAGSTSDLAAKNLGLGSFIREQDIADISNLSNIGSQQQQLGQTGLDVAYQNYLDERAYEDPRSKVAFMSDIIRGAPSGSQSMSTTYQDPMTPLQTIMGLAPLAMAFL